MTRLWMSFAPLILAALPAQAEDQKFKETIADVNGVRINYKIVGSGPAVVLLHGYAQTSHMWLPLMPLLAGSHTVIAPDLRGIGASERPAQGYDNRTRARVIHGVMC